MIAWSTNFPTYVAARGTNLAVQGALWFMWIVFLLAFVLPIVILYYLALGTAVVAKGLWVWWHETHPAS